MRQTTGALVSFVVSILCSAVAFLFNLFSMGWAIPIPYTRSVQSVIVENLCYHSGQTVVAGLGIIIYIIYRDKLIKPMTITSEIKNSNHKCILITFLKIKF